MLTWHIFTSPPRRQQLKLIIQIPCLNEEAQLPNMLSTLPKQVEGFTKVEWLVIDDGSTDRTIQVAKKYGVHHIVKLPQNKGLAAAFQAGIDASLKLGADVIVNTDADNQYDSSYIPALTKPVLEGLADISIGERDLRNHKEFSKLKIKLQLLGSWVVRKASGTNVPDATTGFRAYSKEAAIQLTVINNYTYTIESIIQAGKANSAIISTPIKTNPKTRDSRLFGSMWGYIRRNALTIVRVFSAYEPIKFFGFISLVMFLMSCVAFSPFVFDLLFTGDSSGHIQSIVLGAILSLGALQVLGLGILADQIYSNRLVTQRLLEKTKRLEISNQISPTYYFDDAHLDLNKPLEVDTAYFI